MIQARTHRTANAAAQWMCSAVECHRSVVLMAGQLPQIVARHEVSDYTL